MFSENIIGAVEIGTAKVVAVIGEIVNEKHLNIIGIGEALSQGIKKGEIIDFKKASVAAHAAITTAEANAGVSLASIFLALSGGHLEGFFNEATVTVSSANNLVQENDIQRVKKEAKSKELSANRVYIHHIQNAFSLDARQVGNPLGMVGQKLKVGYWSVHGELQKVTDLIHIINGYGLKVEDIILSSAASATMVVSEIEKEYGCIVLDIGRGTTDFAVYRNGYLIKTGSIPVGGDHLTNDISLGLRIDRGQAERLKVEFGQAYPDKGLKDKVFIECEGGKIKRSIYRNAISQIIHARVEELFNIIKSEIENRVDLSGLSAGVIMTGGSSRLPEICSLASKVFNLEVRLGDNPPWAYANLREPEYSTVLGVLYYALRGQDQGSLIKQKKGHIFSKVAKIFKL